MKNEESLPKYLIYEKSKGQHFLFPKKTAQKWTNFSTNLTFKGSSPFQYDKVRHPNFLSYITS